MCGICGVFNVGTGFPVAIRQLRLMADTLIHRGPDDEGYYVNKDIGFAHRRLSIIDLEGGHQPLANEDQSIWVAFNGEIYNFQELRQTLMAKGHTFKTESDTEVIVHLYEELGEQCFSKLRGMFAIVIWDGQGQKLILARDRVGKKPLYYFYNRKKFVFGSEIKAILVDSDVEREIDLEGLSDYFSLLYVPAPKSIFKSIRKVLPGHYMVISSKGLRNEKYWDLNFSQPLALSEEEWIARVMTTYREAVKLRLVSDVSLGAFLSGGIDSSSVVALMSQITGKPVVTTAMGFLEEEYDELKYAREVAARFQTEHYEEVVQPQYLDIISKLPSLYDEPFADSSALPTYYVSQLAKKHVTVALSGDGGDELFAGYRRYVFDYREQLVRRVFPQRLRHMVFGTLAGVYPKADWAPRIFRGKATFESLACSHIEGYFRSISAVRPELKRTLLHPDVRKALGPYDTLDVLSAYYKEAGPIHPLARIQYVDVKTYLTDDILVKVDRASMAHSLEVRAPMLDHGFMELAATIPVNLKLRGTTGKYILKKALEGMLPREILYRKKMGFAVPLEQWFRVELKDFAETSIFDGPAEPHLDGQVIKQLWREHQSGLRNRATELWTIMIFQLWKKQFSP